MRPIWWVLHSDFGLAILLCSALLAAAENPTSKPVIVDPPRAETPVLFTGLPSVVELPQGTLKFLFGNVDAGKRCDSFVLMPYAGELHAVRVTATGLGSIELSISDKVGNQLVIPDLPLEGIAVRFCVGADLLRQPASSTSGRLIVFAQGYKPTMANIRVDRPGLAPWGKALQWFFAILLPVALAGGFGIGSTWATSRVTQRRDQKSVFRKFKDDNWNELADFFHAHVHNVLKQCQNKREFARRLGSELQSRGYWTSIPWKERDRMERFMKRQEAGRMRSVLAVLFWEWEKDLSELQV